MGRKKKEKTEAKIKEMAIVMIPLPDTLTGGFVNLVRGILHATEDESYDYRRFPGGKSTFVAVTIRPEKKLQLFELLSVFCKTNDLAFKKPYIPLSPA